MTLIEELEEAIEDLEVNYGWENCTDEDMVYDLGKNDGLQMAINIIKSHSDWIPATVSNIPHKEVICCDSCGEEMFGWIFQDEESETGLSAELEGVIMYNVVAWMPKPKPYKGD